MLIQNDNRNYTGIQDKNIIFESPSTKMSTIKGKKALIIHAKLTYKPKACLKCGIVNESYTVIKNGTQTSMIRLCNDHHAARYLKLKKQRFYCKSCCETFMAETHLVKRHCFISNIVKADVISEATKANSVKNIAERSGVSWHTVQRLINHAAKEASPFYNDLPSHLSFDEFKYRKGTLAFDYINAETGRILGIVPGTTNIIIKRHFISRYSIKERNQVKTITIDMNSGYISCIKELFPKADIIIDRFHIVQLIGRSMNKSRISLMNQLRTNTEDQKKYRRLKRHWRLFLKKEKLISYTTYKPYKLFGMRTEFGILNEMLDYNSTFKENYQLYQSLLKAVNDNDYHTFKRILNKDYKDISHYMSVSLKTLRKHQHSIKNTFRYPFSNGRIEGNHNKIKVLNRVAYGFRNLGNYIDRIILHFNLRKNPANENQLAC